jgi:hypothetical protein
VIYQKWYDNELVENIDGCLWVQHYDEYAGLSFWYNDDTHEKIGLRAFDMEHALDIALERYVAVMVNAEVATLAERKEREDQERRERAAVLMMQGKLRVKKANKMMRDLCDVIYLKRYDPYTGKAFYLNLRKKRAQEEKPKLLGRSDVTQPDWFEKCVCSFVCLFVFSPHLLSFTCSPHARFSLYWSPGSMTTASLCTTSRALDRGIATTRSRRASSRAAFACSSSRYASATSAPSWALAGSATIATRTSFFRNV